MSLAITQLGGPCEMLRECGLSFPEGVIESRGARCKSVDINPHDLTLMSKLR